MKLIVGLGNPGDEYKNTRHNTGYIFIDDFAQKNKVTIDKKNELNTISEREITRLKNIDGEKVILLKPLSYMNLSGEVVIKYVNYFKIDVKDILIINDDLDLPIGKIRLRETGSSGGHNGLKNIALHLKTENFKRLKVGISNNKDIDTKDYVLGSFSKEDRETIETMKEEISNLLRDFVSLDFDRLMNKYNKK